MSGSGRTLALHHHPGWLGLVLVGGALGTLSRAALTAGLAPRHGLGNAGATLIINLVGCLLLGFLLEALLRRGADAGVRRGFRLALGTGFCGGFTTYSTLALDVAHDLLAPGELWAAVAYAVGSLVFGLVATGLGVLLGTRVRSDPAARRDDGAADATADDIAHDPLDEISDDPADGVS